MRVSIDMTFMWGSWLKFWSLPLQFDPIVLIPMKAPVVYLPPVLLHHTVKKTNMK